MADTVDPDIPFAEWRRSPAERHAWWMLMDAWVARLRNNHEHLWPPNPRKRERPWPPCWRRHPSLVDFLDAMRRWHTWIVTPPPTIDTAKALVDWHLVVAHGVTQEVRAIAKHCANGHLGPDIRHAKKTIDLTSKARGHWADPLAGPPAAPPAAPPASRPHREPPRRPHDGPRPGEGVS